MPHTSKNPVNTPITCVSACVLVDAMQRIFVQQRPMDKCMGGLWEFPGGKLELGESPHAALIRELREEIGIHVRFDALTSLTFVTHRKDGNAHQPHDLLLLLYGCREWKGEPTSQENQRIDWVSYEDLQSLDMPPADVPLLHHVQSYAHSVPR